MKPVIFSSPTACSCAGWFPGEPCGFMRAFFISGAAALPGVYLGWNIARHFGL